MVMMRILATSALRSVVEPSSRCDTLTRSAAPPVMGGGGASNRMASDRLSNSLRATVPKRQVSSSAGSPTMARSELRSVALVASYKKN